MLDTIITSVLSVLIFLTVWLYDPRHGEAAQLKDEVDGLELLQVEFDNLNRNEADLLDQLDCVRAEKFNISMKLNSLLEALKVMKTLEEDPS